MGVRARRLPGARWLPPPIGRRACDTEFLLRLLRWLTARNLRPGRVRGSPGRVRAQELRTTAPRTTVKKKNLLVLMDRTRSRCPTTRMCFPRCCMEPKTRARRLWFESLNDAARWLLLTSIAKQQFYLLETEDICTHMVFLRNVNLTEGQQ